MKVRGQFTVNAVKHLPEVVASHFRFHVNWHIVTWASTHNTSSILSFSSQETVNTPLSTVTQQVAYLGMRISSWLRMFSSCISIWNEILSVDDSLQFLSLIVRRTFLFTRKLFNGVSLRALLSVLLCHPDFPKAHLSAGKPTHFSLNFLKLIPSLCFHHVPARTTLGFWEGTQSHLRSWRTPSPGAGVVYCWREEGWGGLYKAKLCYL